jgi:hypothetical protein
MSERAKERREKEREERERCWCRYSIGGRFPCLSILSYILSFFPSFTPATR